MRPSSPSLSLPVLSSVTVTHCTSAITNSPGAVSLSLSLSALIVSSPLSIQALTSNSLTSKFKMLVSSNLLLPPWLQALLTEKFFVACAIHGGARKNEKNIFCLDCCISTCPHCLSPHNSHRLLQIRRYVYNDVLRLGDAQKLFDCAFVQSYTTNSAKVIFLNQRPQTRAVNIRGNICSTCDRGLQYPYLFCSISCKIDHILRRKDVSGLSSFLYDCKFLPLPEPGSDDGLMTPDSVLEPFGSTKTSSSSGGYGGVDCRALACTATTEIVRKKRSNLTNSGRTIFPRATELSTNLMNRRKKAPNRAPLY